MGDGWCFLLRSEGKCAGAIRDKLLDNLPSARVEENTRSWGGGPLQSISAGTLCGAESGDGQVGDMNLTLEKVAWIGGSNMTIKVLVTEGVWGHPLDSCCSVLPVSVPFPLSLFSPRFRYQGHGAWAWPGRIHSPVLLPIQQVWWKRNAGPCLLYWLLIIKHLLYKKPAYLPSCPNSWGHYLELPPRGLPPLPVEPLFSPSPSPLAIHLLAWSPLTWENQIMHLSLP